VREPDAAEESYFWILENLFSFLRGRTPNWYQGLLWTHEKKTNRESARIPQAFGLLSESDLLILTFASLLCSLAHPSSGAFGQILSPPQRLL